MTTRGADRARFGLFLDRAEQFLRAGTGSLLAQDYDAAASNAIHAAIAAMDAVTVYYAGRRSASQRHEDAIEVLRSLRLPGNDIGARLRQFERLLGLKTKAEYADARVTAAEAGDAVRSAERIVAWAHEQTREG